MSNQNSDFPALDRPCQNVDELWRWVRHHLGLSIPRKPVCQGHAAPFDYLASAYFEPAKDLVVWAPRGGGKTRLGAVATLLDLLHKPGISVRILGGSLDQSLRMWEHLLPDLETLAQNEIVGKPRARRVALKSGSVAGVVTQSQRAVRGLRVQKLRCDEVEMFDPAVWEAAQLITRSRPSKHNAGATFAGTVEAMSTMHVSGGLMERIVDRAIADGTCLLKWGLLETLAQCEPDRPCEGCLLREECNGKAKQCDGFVTIEDAIKMKRRVSVRTWEAEMLCVRPSVEGTVFPTFEPALHVRETLPGPAAEESELWLAMDFGFRAPFVCLWIRSDSLGRTFVVDEYTQPAQIVDTHIQEIKKRAHGFIRRVACDPAGSAPNEQTGKSNVQLLRDADWKVCFRSSLIVEGLDLIRAQLQSASGETRLFIHPRCKTLIAAMRGYHYKPGGGEVPEKDGTHDHPIDALRYYYVNRSSGRVGGGWY